MNKGYWPRQTRIGSAIVGIAVLFTARQANAEAPSNARLIAAMPPGTESVLVNRVAMLKQPDSVFHAAYSGKRYDSSSKNIKAVVRDMIEWATPEVWAWGASDFQMPPDTGMTGNYNERAIYIVEESLDRLRARLETREEIEGIDEMFDVGGVKVFKGTIDDKSAWGRTHNSAGESWFVAILDPHTVVSAESRTDIEYMLTALKENRTSVPTQWRDIAKGHDLESPVVLLRSYSLQLGGPLRGTDGFLPPAESGSTHFALSLPSVTSATLRVSIAANDTDKALEWYKQDLPESGHVWTAQSAQKGVTATVAPKPERGKPEELVFIWILLFGPCVMI